MAKAWSQVLQDPAFQALPPDQQESARQQYFQQVIAPQAGAQADQAKAQFDAQYGPGSAASKTVVVTPANGTTEDENAPSVTSNPFVGAGRQIAMSAHSLARSVPGLIDLVTAVPRAGLNAAEEKLGISPEYRFGALGDAASQGLTAAGVPDYQPQTKTEQYIQAANRGIGGVVGGVGTGAGLSAVGGPTAAGIGSTLSSNPGIQTASALTGSLSGEAAKQAGAGPVGQTAAALVGGLAPVAPQIVQAGTQAALVGGQAGRQRVAQTIQDFANAGATPTVGQAVGTPLVRGAESLLSKTPGAVNVMKGAAENQAGQVSNKLSDIANTLSPGADSGAAGGAIIGGVSGPGGFVDRFKTASQNLYNKLDQFLPAQKPVDITNTQKALSDINAGTPGAANTSALMQNPKLVQLERAVQSDAQNGQLPYEAIKQIRSMIGDQLSDFQLTSDVPRAKLKQLYGALSDDMQQAAKDAGTPAEQAWNQANSFYKNGQAQIDTLQRVIDKNGGPEAVFNSAMSGTKEGASTLNTVMDALTPEQQKVVSAAVINRLGKANPGAQNAAGDEFSMGTFLTNWNKLSPQAKQTLFSNSGPNVAKNMDAIASVAENVRNGSKYLYNPSGTAASGAQIGTVGTMVLSALTGHPGTTAALAAGMGGANGLARLMTNPTFVNFLATHKNVPAQGLVPALTSLQATAEKKKDPDLKAAADVLLQQAQGAQ